jgi:hypothetical protein
LSAFSFDYLQQKDHLFIPHPIRAHEIDSEANHNRKAHKKNFLDRIASHDPIRKGTDQVGY